MLLLFQKRTRFVKSGHAITQTAIKNSKIYPQTLQQSTQTKQKYSKL